MCVRACGVCVCDPVEGRAAALVAGADDGAPGDEGEGEVRPPRLGHQVQRPLPVLVRLPFQTMSQSDEGEGEVRPPRLGHEVQRPLPVLVRLP